MNFNPFTRQNSVSSVFHRYPHPPNMFDRTVGRPEQMGVFDYALVVPALVKLGLHLSAKKKKLLPLTIVFGAISVPLAVTKFALYLGTSPIIFVAWLIKQGVKKEYLKHVVSPYTETLNSLMVTTPDSEAARLLNEVSRLHDNDLSRFSIVANNNNQLVLTRFPGNEVVATLLPTRQNIMKLQSLIDGDHINQNRLMYFLTNVGNSIINFSAKERINAISTSQALNHVNLMHKLLVHCSVDNTERDSSFACIPKDVRKIIAREAILMETNEALATGIYHTFTQEERELATADYIGNPRP